jgi:hypothetical protein
MDGHVARLIQKMKVYKILAEKPKGTRLGDLSIDGRIILKYILEKYGVTMWTGLI